MAFSWQTPLMRLACAMLALYVVADVAFLAVTGIAVSMHGLVTLALSVLGVFVIAAVMVWIARRLEGDEDKIGRALRRTAITGHTIIQVGVFFVLLSAAGALLSYLVVTPGFPLRDAHFAAADHMIGFDWVAFLSWVNDRPWLAKILLVAYHSSAAQMAMLIIVLSWLGQIRNLQQYIALYAVSACAVLILSGLFPALGAYAYHAPDPSLFSNMTGNAGRWHLDAYNALIDGTFSKFDWKAAEGIVSFPSFHTILAIITAYAMRDVRQLAWPFYVFSLVVILSTLPEGGHFLIDIFAGGAIALVAIVAIRRIDGQRTRVRDLFPPAPARLTVAANLATKMPEQARS